MLLARIAPVHREIMILGDRLIQFRLALKIAGTVPVVVEN
jgi:hypothetical protein